MQKFVLPIALLLGFSATLAQAQPYPSRPIRVVVPFPAAGNVDTYIRQLARQMEISMGQPLVIDNRSGANGIVGCDIVASDRDASREELRLLELLRDKLDLDGLISAAIERGARARHMTV